MRLGCAALSLILVLAVACTENIAPPTAPTTPPSDSTEMFTGTLSPMGTEIHGFNVLVQATTTLTLASLRRAGTSTTLSTPVTLLLGSLNADGSACTGTTTMTTSPGLTAQINQLLLAGVYCVSIADTGGLPGDADFAIRIYEFTGTVTTGQPGTEKFSSNLYPFGNVTRTFAASQNGDVKVTLTNVTPPASIGFGLGIANGSDCLLTQSTVTTAGSGGELNLKADAGAYCVKVFDPGSLPGRVTFFFDITHQ